MSHKLISYPPNVPALLPPGSQAAKPPSQFPFSLDFKPKIQNDVQQQ
jgi:hypothetical protein